MGLSSSIFSFEAYRSFRAQAAHIRAWHALICASAIAVCWLCSELQVRVFRPPVWNAGAAEVLFIGSSHMKDSVDPEHYSRTTGRLWFPAMAMNLARATFAKHSALWPDLELVLIEVDEWTLVGEPMKLAKDDYTIFSGMLQLNAWDLPEREDPWAQFKLTLANLRLGRGITALHEDMRFNTGTVLRELMGFGSILPATANRATTDKKFDFNATLARQRVGYLSIIRVESPEENLQAAVDLALHIRETGARVALITFPTHEIYNAARWPTWDGLISDCVARVRAALAPEEVPYWDFRNHAQFQNTRVYRNQDHLNAVGARQLAGILEQRISTWLSNNH